MLEENGLNDNLVDKIYVKVKSSVNWEKGKVVKRYFIPKFFSRK